VAKSSRRGRGRVGVDVEAASSVGGASSVGAFPKLRPLTRCSPFTARNDLGSSPGGSTHTRAINSSRRSVVIVYAFGGGDSDSAVIDGGGGFGVLASEEEAEADAAERLSFLNALVMKKRLYFAILAACERCEVRGGGLYKLRTQLTHSEKRNP
jgi:hypothetical protein